MPRATVARRTGRPADREFDGRMLRARPIIGRPPGDAAARSFDSEPRGSSRWSPRKPSGALTWRIPLAAMRALRRKRPALRFGGLSNSASSGKKMPPGVGFWEHRRRAAGWTMRDAPRKYRARSRAARRRNYGPVLAQVEEIAFALVADRVAPCVWSSSTAGPSSTRSVPSAIWRAACRARAVGTGRDSTSAFST